MCFCSNPPFFAPSSPGLPRPVDFSFTLNLGRGAPTRRTRWGSWGAGEGAGVAQRGDIHKKMQMHSAKQKIRKMHALFKSHRPTVLINSQVPTGVPKTVIPLSDSPRLDSCMYVSRVANLASDKPSTFHVAIHNCLGEGFNAPPRTTFLIGWRLWKGVPFRKSILLLTQENENTDGNLKLRMPAKIWHLKH